jgi:hypothetical protein
MKRPSLKALVGASLFATATTLCSAAETPVLQLYLVTNDNVTLEEGPGPNSATVYSIGGSPTAPTLTQLKVIPTGGLALGNGQGSAGQQIATAQVGGKTCIFVSDGPSNDIAAIDSSNFQVVGNFQGSGFDDGSNTGIGLATNGKFLYATYGGSDGNIGVFQIQAGCRLGFLKDVFAAGLNALSNAVGSAANDHLLVLAFGDGSIMSFQIGRDGFIKSSDDEQNSTGYLKRRSAPHSVQITNDGHYAIFGDGTFKAPMEVEVSDISSGRLTKTVDYHFSPKAVAGSFDLELSPDNKLLYVSNFFTGQVTALNFDPATGVVSYGCSSKALKGFSSRLWTTVRATVTAGTSGTGTALFVAEDSPADPPPPSYVGVVRVHSNGETCRLTELPASPVQNGQSGSLQYLSAFGR